MNPTDEPQQAPKPAKTPKPPKPPVSIAKLTLHDKVVETKVKLVGESAAAFLDYQKAYKAAHGEDVDPALLASQMVAVAIEGDKSFAAWRRQNVAKG